MTTYYTQMESRIGPLLLTSDGANLTGLYMGANLPAVKAEWVESESALPFAEARRQLSAYFAGEATDFDLPLRLRGTPFQQQVWEELRRLPFGTTVSYGELARRIGNPNACRAVGLANGRNPISIVVPCHRVIGANGKLVGYSGGMPCKEQLLMLEAKKDRQGDKEQEEYPKTQAGSHFVNGECSCSVTTYRKGLQAQDNTPVLCLVVRQRKQGKESMPQIVVENLRKTFQVAERQAGTWGALRGLYARRYKTVTALDDISFTLDAGELVGYIGPNGAGKSTTVKALSGILVPDGGKCEVLGYVPWRDRRQYVGHIGVVFGQRTQLWWDLPVIESFDLLRDIYRVPGAQYAQARDELIPLLSLSDFLDTPVRQLSLGQRMRCDLAAALLHSPRLLFLDEPTIGLDAVSKLAVREFVKKLNRERGVTVILTTHDMDDVEALCTRVIVIAGGQILSDGSLEDLRTRVTRERWLLVDLETPSGGHECAIEDPDASVLRQEGQQVCLRFDPQQVSTAALIARITARYPVKDLFVQNPPIEEIIARLYRENET